MMYPSGDAMRDVLNLYNDRAPLEEAFTIPASWYTDERIGRLERDGVFGHSWQVVGRIEQVTAPGQYITAEVAGEPILVARGTDGVLRAFFNVCRHHAAAVAVEPCGQAESFRCPYHGWNYGLDGTLKGAPEFQGVCNFDRAANGLVEVRVDAWEQFIFVALASGASPLRDFLGDLSGRMAALNLGNLKHFEQRTYVLGCNWKVFVDNYLDGGYHVPHLHKGLNSVLDYKQYTIDTGERYCLQSSPMTDSSEDATVAAARKGDRAHYYWLYPNFMINIYEGVMDTNLVIPMGIDRTKVVFDFYFSDLSPERHQAHAESISVSERIQNEDVGICESVQRGLASRAYSAGRLSVRREAGELLFHRLLARDLKAAAT